MSFHRDWSEWRRHLRNTRLLFSLELRLSVAQVQGRKLSGWRSSAAVMVLAGLFLQVEGSGTVGVIRVTMLAIALMLMVPQVAASYGREKELGTLDQMMATPVGSHSVFLGKWLAICVLILVLILFGHVGLLLGLPLRSSAPLGAFWDSSLQGMTLIGLGGYLIAVLVMVGLIVSAASPNSVEAQRRLQALGFMGLFALLAAGMGIVWLLSQDPVVDATSPMVQAVVRIQSANPGILTTVIAVLAASSLVVLGLFGGWRTRRRRLWN